MRGGEGEGRGEGGKRGGRRREGRGGLSGNVTEAAFCLKSAPVASGVCKRQALDLVRKSAGKHLQQFLRGAFSARKQQFVIEVSIH